MNICILDGYPANPGDLSWKRFEDFGKLSLYPRSTASELIERAAQAEVILTNKVPIGKEILDVLTRLKYIGVLATGYNIIDVDYARQLDIPVTNIPGYSRDSVAQTVFSYILQMYNRVSSYDQAVKNGRWNSSSDFCFYLDIPRELAGKTLGIVGYGDIGRKVGQIARAFGMDVVCARKPDGGLPRLAEEDIASERVRAEDLSQVFAQSDVISLHVPLSSNTKHLVGTELLSMCKASALLINTARGAVVDANAVYRALNEGKLGAYASDVFESEPPKEHHPLLYHPNSMFTPHVAWASREARSRALDIAYENVAAWVQGKPIHVVNGVNRGRG